MEDVEILRSLGTSPDVMERYVELRDKMHRAYLPMFFVLFLMIIDGCIYFVVGPILDVDKDLLFNVQLAIFILVFTIALPFEIIYIKTFRKYLEVMKEGWLIDFASVELQRLSLQVVLYALYLSIMTMGLILFYRDKDWALMLFFLCLIIVFTPLLIIANKKTKELGYRILHLFPCNVDEITEKIEKALGGEKKTQVNGWKYRRYQINFPNSHNFVIYAFPRTDTKGFVEVAIAGVKLENVAAAREIVSKIEALLTQQ